MQGRTQSVKCLSCFRPAEGTCPRLRNPHSELGYGLALRTGKGKRWAAGGVPLLSRASGGWGGVLCLAVSKGDFYMLLPPKPCVPNALEEIIQ